MMVPDPSKIFVPRRQGEILINPPLGMLAEAARKGRDFSRAEGTLSEIFGEPFLELRQRQRQSFVEAVRQHSQAMGDVPPEFPPHAPCIITGHQVEFYHAGVWAKVIAADVLAKRTSGVAVDLLVDHDLVEEMGFDVPAQETDGTWKRRPLVFAGAPASPVEGIAAPDAATVEGWIRELRTYPEARSDALASYVKELAPSTGISQETYTTWMSRARRNFEKSLGLNVAHVPTTLTCAGPAWVALVQAWVRHALPWTAAYNRHLAEYRKRQGIKNPEHPMPDLVRNTGAGTFELPFWIYQHGEPRERLIVRAGDAPAIIYKNEAIPLTPELLSGQAPFAIRPRALTLTMFVRIFLADVFIHGIGGALYDQITDNLMSELFGHDTAASYGCVSAAWLLPIAERAENPASVPWLKWQMHHLKHNPQLVMAVSHQQYPPAAQALARRRELLESIADSLEVDRRRGREARRKWFDEFHAVNAQLHEIAPEKTADLARRLTAALKAAHDNKVLLWREWFFALHTLSSLRALVDKMSA